MQQHRIKAGELRRGQVLVFSPKRWSRGAFLGLKHCRWVKGASCSAGEHLPAGKPLSDHAQSCEKERLGSETRDLSAPRAQGGACRAWGLQFGSRTQLALCLRRAHDAPTHLLGPTHSFQSPRRGTASAVGWGNGAQRSLPAASAGGEWKEGQSAEEPAPGAVGREGACW